MFPPDVIVPAQEGFVTDEELLRALRVPEKFGYAAIAELDKQRGRSGAPFPAKDPLFGNRRYMPAVRAWLANRYGMATISPEIQDGLEKLNVPKDRRRDRAPMAQAR